MVVLDWNISYASRIQEIISEIKHNVENQEFIVTLQEVIPSSSEALIAAFAGMANIRYGAQTFFQTLRECGSLDAYASKFKVGNYLKGQPLAVSHLIGRKRSMPRRYDFLFCHKDLSLKAVDYYFAEAQAASSDHAFIKAELVV